MEFDRLEGFGLKLWNRFKQIDQTHQHEKDQLTKRIGILIQKLRQREQTVTQQVKEINARKGYLCFPFPPTRCS